MADGDPYLRCDIGKGLDVSDAVVPDEFIETSGHPRPPGLGIQFADGQRCGLVFGWDGFSAVTGKRVGAVVGELLMLNDLKPDLLHQFVVNGTDLPMHQGIRIGLAGLEVVVDHQPMDVEKTALGVCMCDHDYGLGGTGSSQHLVGHIHGRLDIIRAR